MTRAPGVTGAPGVTTAHPANLEGAIAGRWPNATGANR